MCPPARCHALVLGRGGALTGRALALGDDDEDDDDDDVDDDSVARLSLDFLGLGVIRWLARDSPSLLWPVRRALGVPTGSWNALAPALRRWVRFLLGLPGAPERKPEEPQVFGSERLARRKNGSLGVAFRKSNERGGR